MTARTIHACTGSGGGESSSTGAAVIDVVAGLCRSAVGGRRSSRALAEWALQFALSEAEFLVLWSLRTAQGEGCDQITLAKELALSTAQVSATVERLRIKGSIVQQFVPGDRRRHLWRLSAEGRKLLDQMLAATALLRCEARSESECVVPLRSREAAA